MKKISIIIVTALLFVLASCSLDVVPSGQMTSEQLKNEPASAKYMTTGNYSMFKDVLSYKGTEETKNTYVRHLMQMTEFRGDNASLCAHTTDHLFQAMDYSDTQLMDNNTYMWWIAYRIIYGANSVIESLKEGESNEWDHILGENYFMRAICHLHLVNMFAKPYSHGADNPGVILRNSTDTSVTQRATVGAVYGQIESDLMEAARLMGKSATPRGNNKGYASKEAAQGLLSRVYLYMGKDQAVIDLVGEMLGGADPSTKLTPTGDLQNYFANALDRSETLWAVAYTPEDKPLGQSSIGSMYYTDDVGTGWGEIFYSDLLLDLYSRYDPLLGFIPNKSGEANAYAHEPVDKRLMFFKTRQSPNAATSGVAIRWSAMNTVSNTAYPVVMNAFWDAAANNYYFEEVIDPDVPAVTRKTYLEEETVNTYPVYYVTLIDGTRHRARLAPRATEKGGVPQFFMTKFSGQGGDGMLSSPVMLRWAEVILNRAEAYAKVGGRDAEALADVNVLRTRAGLPTEAMFTTANMAARGYTDVLDVVLDERRLELCFEGHRAIDQFRNMRELDRRYAGAQQWEVIQPTNNRFVYRIPFDEISVSGVAQNP